MYSSARCIRVLDVFEYYMYSSARCILVYVISHHYVIL
jgi:hypothetical protein